jgi:hypothetical protein
MFAPPGWHPAEFSRRSPAPPARRMIGTMRRSSAPPAEAKNE